MKAYLCLLLEVLPDNIDVIVGHLHHFPGFVAGEPESCLRISHCLLVFPFISTNLFGQ